MYVSKYTLNPSMNFFNLSNRINNDVFNYEHIMEVKMIRFDKHDYEEIKQIISSMKIENISYAGVFANVANEFMKNHDCNFTYCRANNSINTTEVKDMQIIIFKAMRELGINYKSMVFADSKNSVLKNRVLKEFRAKKLGKVIHWYNNPNDISKYVIDKNYSIDWRGRQYCKYALFDYQQWKPLREFSFNTEYDMRASGIRILGCLLRDEGLVLDLIDPEKGDYYHNTDITFKDGEILKYGLMQYIYGFGRDITGEYVSKRREDVRDLKVAIPGDWNNVDNILRETVSKFNEDDDEIYYRLPDGWITDFKKFHTVTINLNENWIRNSRRAGFDIPELEDKDGLNIFSMTVPGYSNGKFMKGVTANIIHSWDAWLLREVARNYGDKLKGSIHDCYILDGIEFEDINSFVSGKLAWIYQHADELVDVINKAFRTNIKPKEFDKNVYERIMTSESVKVEEQAIHNIINKDNYMEYRLTYNRFIADYDVLIRKGMIPADEVAMFRECYNKLKISNSLIDEYLNKPEENIYKNNVADGEIAKEYALEQITE